MRLPSPASPTSLGGGGGLAEITDDLKKLINFSIRSVCDRAAVGEEPRCALCKFDIVDGCCDGGACEGDLIGFVFDRTQVKKKSAFQNKIFRFFFSKCRNIKI